MGKDQIKTTHDQIAKFFTLNKHRLLAYLYNLATANEMKSTTADMCVWPVEPHSGNIDRWELCQFHIGNPGPIRSGIYFRGTTDTTKKIAVQVCQRINEQIYGLDADQAYGIVVQATRRGDSREQDQQTFDQALLKIVSNLTPEQILKTPGCYEALAEQYNNQAQDVIVRYSADPEHEPLGEGYCSKEVIQILTNDLEMLVGKMQKEDLSDEGRQQLADSKESISMGKDFIKTLESIKNHQI